MTKTNDFGQPILFETPNNGNGYFEFAQFYGGYDRPYALRGISPSGDFAYLGLFEQAEIRGLAKAILNTMEPESLVENQKDPEPTYKPGDWVKVAANSPYNSSFRGQTLRLADDQSLYSADGFAVLLVGAEGYSGAVSKRWITPASAPEPAIVPAPFKVGDRVRVVSGKFGPSDASRGDLGTVNEIRNPYVSVNVDGKARRFPFLRSEIEHAPVEEKRTEKTLSTRLDDLEDRVTALETQPEPEPSLWGYKVGDRVEHTEFGAGLSGWERKVVAIDVAEGSLSLAHPADPKARVVGHAFSANEITRA